MHCAGTYQWVFFCLFFFLPVIFHCTLWWWRSFFFFFCKNGLPLLQFCYSANIFLSKRRLAIFFLLPMTTLWLSKRQSLAILLLVFFFSLNGCAVTREGVLCIKEISALQMSLFWYFKSLYFFFSIFTLGKPSILHCVGPHSFLCVILCTPWLFRRADF